MAEAFGRTAQCTVVVGPGAKPNLKETPIDRRQVSTREERAMGFSASSLTDMGSIWDDQRSRTEAYNYPLTPAEIWNVATGQREKVIEVPREWRCAYTVSFAPDSNLVAIGGFRKFGIFSVDRGELLVTETHHRRGFFEDSELPSQLNRVEFSPDGRMLLTSGDDKTVQIWRLDR